MAHDEEEGDGVMRIEQSSLNPENPRQARIFYDMYAAEAGHPMDVVRRLSTELGFTILDAVPQTMFDGWDIWIEFNEPLVLPDYFRSVPWRFVGSA